VSAGLRSSSPAVSGQRQHPSCGSDQLTGTNTCAEEDPQDKQQAFNRVRLQIFFYIILKARMISESLHAGPFTSTVTCRRKLLLVGALVIEVGDIFDLPTELSVVRARSQRGSVSCDDLSHFRHHAGTRDASRREDRKDLLDQQPLVRILIPVDSQHIAS